MRTIALALLGCGVLGCGDSSSHSDGGSDAAVADLGASARRLVVLYTNDEHSHLFASAPELDDFPAATVAGTGPLRGGVTRRATLLASERAAATAAGAATLTLSAGDNVMGTLPEVGFVQSAPDFTLMKMLGYDVTCLGNHEFDYGPKSLALALTAAKAKDGLIATVSTNIHFDPVDPGDDALAAIWGDDSDPSKLVKRYHVATTANGLKIGFVGIVGANAAFVETPKRPVTFSLGASQKESQFPEVLTALYADIQPAVDALRTVEKVDLVFALSHSGVDLATPENGEDYQIAQQVSGIDVIISGHTHSRVDAPIVVKNTATGKPVVIVQSGAFGAFLGRLDLTVSSDGTLGFDPITSKLLPVDESIVPDTGKVAQAELAMVKSLEQDPFANGNQSFLEGALSRIEGAPVVHDPNAIGGLFFRPLGKASFAITGDPALFPSRETPILDLTADAMLAAADKYFSTLGSGEITDVAVQAEGVIRGDLPVGKTGVLAFADLFRILPLGSSREDGSIGYSLVHAYLYQWELKAAFELAASSGLADASLFLVPSAMKVTFDTSRPVFSASGKDPTDPANGRVTKIEAMSSHAGGYEGPYDYVLFDASKIGAAAWNKGDPFALVGVVTSYYIASFASSAGVGLRDRQGNARTLAQSVIHRGDGSELKDFEGFAEYVRAQSTKNRGTLPPIYDGKVTPVPRRMLCGGPLCPK